MHSQSRRYFFLIKITNPLLHSTLRNYYFCFHFHIFLLIWSHFGVEIAKKLPFDLENFLPFGRGKSNQTYLQTCNLQTDQFISYNSVYQYWLNLPHPNGKKFSRLNVKKISPDCIFWHLDGQKWFLNKLLLDTPTETKLRNKE